MNEPMRREEPPSPSLWSRWFDGMWITVVLMIISLMFSAINFLISVVSQGLEPNGVVIIAIVFALLFGPIMVSTVFRALDRATLQR
jgi:hypothetical protein